VENQETKQTVITPDFSQARHGFHHTVESAMMALLGLGIGPERVTITKAGRGWAPRRVVEQYPSPGAPLTPETQVELLVEGEGMFFHLPVGGHEAPPEGQAGARDLAVIFDDAIEKAAIFIRLGGLFFNLHPENPQGCARWISLFGLDPDDWPKDRWYKLAVLLPSLRSLAGREPGLRLALKMMLDLEIAQFGRLPWKVFLDPADQSLVETQSSRLGIDALLGDSLEDEALFEITLRANSLEQYRRFETAEGQAFLEQVLCLVAPYHWVYEIKWLVGDLNRAPRLGVEAENAILGVSSHLGIS
jgi:hypothetical protein